MRLPAVLQVFVRQDFVTIFLNFIVFNRHRRKSEDIIKRS